MYITTLNTTDNSRFSWAVYTFYPYGPNGPEVIQLGTYDQELYVYKEQRLFPDKYRNFHGGVVNVTSLEHTPHFMSRVEIKEDGTEETIMFGSDGMLLHAMEDKLNFTSYLLPAKTWEEVIQFVIDRIALISPVYWELVPDQLVTHDMTVVYEHADFAFSMATTPPKPHWSGLFLPMTIDAWLGIFVTCLIASLGLALVLYVKERDRVSSKLHALAEATYEIIATLLDQNFNFLLPESAAGRIIMLFWLIYTFIISSSYRANLKAFLMKPNPPLRAETVEELVDVVDKVTAEAYLHSTKIFFLVSDYPAYKKIGELMDIGYETSVGMQTAVDNKRATHVDFLKHMNHVLVEKFTRPDGTTALYIGNNQIVQFPACMPVPHDLPFLPHIDQIIMEVVQAGLMDKWYDDEIEKARRKSLKQQREYREKLIMNNEIAEEKTTDDGERAWKLEDTFYVANGQVTKYTRTRKPLAVTKGLEDPYKEQLLESKPS
ncbi:glutamate receptor ionotropic, kainate 1-like [Palaemon carinicauda]|uniref:glutamate receptor ionotropic, kainate 1-like n=1 Tax=Palaemon carinicauda TaxID=392227 RepID=UPI0035B69AC1